MVEQPNISAIESAIRRLDGVRTTEACIESEGDDYLILGGGNGLYVGFVSRGESEFYNLLAPSGSSERQIELCAGGQTGFYRERQVIDLATAIQAARTFALSGELEESVNWEIQK